MDDYIKKIKKGIENDENIEYFEKIYDDTWETIRWNAMTIENDVFYRARILDKDELYLNVNELKYPKANFVSKKGRLNDIGESVAYLSTGELTPLAELDVGYYQIFCMTEIKYNIKDICFFCIGVKAEYGGLTEKEHKFIAFFNELLTTPNEKYYNATIAFAHKIFESNLIKDGEKQKIGIIYNSAQEHKTNKLLHNIAIQPDIFDECFSFNKAVYQIMSYDKVDNCIRVNEINKGEILNTGEIIWEKNYEQMINYIDELFKNDAFMKYDPEGRKYIIKYPEGIGRITEESEEYYHVDFKNNGLKKVKKTVIN